MTSAREAFLERVRQAVRQGNRPGQAAPLPARGQVGYQGAGADPLARFRDELSAAGGFPWLVSSGHAAIDTILQMVQKKGARKALLSRGAFIDRLGLQERLESIGLEVITPDRLGPASCRDPFFAADIGISGVDYLIAETGSVVHLSKPTDPRSATLLPPIHIAVADKSQLLPDLFDLFDLFRRDPAGEPESGEVKSLPSGLTLITGPSKTGDIELKLVTGVHGPGEIHVIVVDAR